jgi:hypothetical protein
MGRSALTARKGAPQMQAGLIMLCLAYVLSQFFRAFLGVLTTVLGHWRHAC